MPTFYPSDPHNTMQTQAEEADWKAANAEKKAKEKRDTRRFIVTAVLSGIAALAAVAGVIIQLVSAQ